MNKIEEEIMDEIFSNNMRIRIVELYLERERKKPVFYPFMTVLEDES